ncbi:hypothetical protein FIBSPDRAFT_861104 [Athelia psychrophila]|uniref:Uncharacterized protein n=1 Tax=Athelia psychrophila TaxID=1759441 RepID=A0A166JK98_9AGAM|nr:hypothetical protein FIBSPDRAFT_861104 [Fibularhizoctonia sp. CBS 109695]
MSDNNSTSSPTPQTEQPPQTQSPPTQLPPTQLPPAQSPDKLTPEQRIQAANEQLSPNSQQQFQAQINELLKKIEEAQAASAEARQRADEATDPAEKQRLIDEAVKQEKIAAAELKIVKKLQSGLWQGGVGGAGIGIEIGAGVGAVVGSLVGGITAIPTTLLGGLGGLAAGAIHGPWYKISGEEASAGGKTEKEANDGENTLTEEEVTGVEKALAEEETNGVEKTEENKEEMGEKKNDNV